MGPTFHGLLLVVAVLLASGTIGVQADDTPAGANMLSLLSSYDNCHAYDSGSAYEAIPFSVIFWSVDQASSTINFAMNCYSANLPLGYCALGIKTFAQTGTGAALSMPTTDAALVIRYANDSVIVTDFYLGPARSKCSPGGLASDQGVCHDTDVSPPGTNDVTDAGQGQVLLDGRKLTARWSRPIAATDAYDFAIENALQHILFASRSNSSTAVAWNPLDISRHDIVNPGVASDQINFLATPSCPRSCSGHGTCTKGCCVCDAGFAALDCSVSITNTTVPILTPTIDPSQYEFPLKELGRGIKLTWKLHPNKQSPTMVEIALDVDTNGWVGFGVGKGMIGADVAIGLGQPAISVADYFISARAVGCPKGVCADSSISNGKNDILAFNGNTNTRPDGTPGMQIKFVRMLNTGDTAADRVWSAGNNDIVWAKGSAQLARHGNHRFDRNRATVNFLTGKVEPATDLSAIHGWLMSIAWLVLIPAAAFIARFSKDSLGPWWFHLHRALTLVAVLMSLIAFVIIIIYTEDDHFEILHARLGLFIIFMSILNPVIGLVADLLYKPNRQNTPLLPDVLHWVIGWTLVICAVINVLLGLSRYEFAPVYSWVLYFIAAFTILIVNFSFLVWNVARGKTGLGPRKRD